MDLGLEGKTAIVCASSRGLGRACAEALAREGAWVVINGMNPATLEKTAGELRKSGARIDAVCADVTTEEGRRQILAVLPQPDIPSTMLAVRPQVIFATGHATIG